MKRYFIVSVAIYAKDSSNPIHWQIDVVSNNGGYVNRVTLEKRIKDRHKAKDVMITNIIELSESDFNDWTYQEKKAE